MKLEKLIEGVTCHVVGNLDQEVCGIANVDNKVVENGCYVAICGTKTDGHNFIDNAVAGGARVIVVEREFPKIDGVTQVVVDNSRQALSVLAANYFGNPARDLTMIGVTGTNGKTSTTFMIRHIFESCGICAGVVGTNGVVWKDKCVLTGLTTPDPIELHKNLAKMKEDGVSVVAMEVSAHALDLCKTCGIVFDVAIFTNLSQDHLDYFGNMRTYASAKAKLFLPFQSKRAVVCTDNKMGCWLKENAKIPTFSFGCECADFEILSLFSSDLGQQFVLNGKNQAVNVNLPLLGKFNCLNAVGAMACADLLGIPLHESALALSTLPEIGGRFNTFKTNFGALIVVDYAHTPDGLENVLECAKELANSRGGRLVSVFGCGGNRDASKRPQMGAISERIADFSIVTSDNPRYEKPGEIAEMIVSGMKKDNHTVVLQRENAIEVAIGMLGVKDVLVISGKGVEDYIEENGQKMPYSDADTVMRILGKRER